MSKRVKSPAEKARVKYADYCRQIGKPLHITQEELAELRAHLTALHEQGMSYQGICASAPGNHNETSASKVIHHKTNTVHRDTYNDLMQARYEHPTGKNAGTVVDPCGPRRRLRALVASGFGYQVLGELLGTSGQAVFQLVTSDRPARASMAIGIISLYAKLEHADPFDYGSTKLGVSRAKGVGRRNNWAPASCWDTDTIDDPDAFPEWTGACGTERGWRIHYREHLLPVCQPCQTARDEYRATLNNGRGGRESVPGFAPGRFAELRATKGASYRKLGALAGVDESVIAHWENGRNRPSPDMLHRVLTVLDATWEDVCDDGTR